MPTVVAVHTSLSIAAPIAAFFDELLPDVRLINIADDSLIQDVIAAGEVTPAVVRRLVAYYQAAEQAGADVIFNTCSSVGEVPTIGQLFVNVPIQQIDHPMADAAVAQGQRIGVLATLPTTLGPTVRLVRARAEAAGREVAVQEGLATGAFQAFLDNRFDDHDARIMQVANGIAEQVDLFVLAQASMGRLQAALADATGKPVLTSPRLGVEAVGRLLQERAS